MSYRPNTWVRVEAWTRINSSTFTVTDNSIYQSIFQAGKPVRYRGIGGAWRYGIVISYVTGTVTLSGAAITISDDDEMEYNGTEKVVTWRDHYPSNLTTGDDQGSPALKWGEATAYLVRVTGQLETAPTGANDVRFAVGVGAAGNDVLSSPTYIELGGATEVDSGVNINVANYDIQFGEKIFLNIDQIGDTLPGAGLAVNYTFVKQ